jgi:predicted DNA-binding transcriptional regulator AlpA
MTMDMTTIGSPANDPIIPGWRGASSKSGRSIPALKRDVRSGRFPPPIEIGPNRIGWRHSEIEAWIASRPRRQYGAASAA